MKERGRKRKRPLPPPPTSLLPIPLAATTLTRKQAVDQNWDITKENDKTEVYKVCFDRNFCHLQLNNVHSVRN